MKKFKLPLQVILLVVITSIYGQKPTMELTFTAENNGQYVPLDSIFIENLTQGGDTMLYAPDTMLVLDYTVGVAVNPSSNTGFRVSQNRPNPFAEQTIISIFLPEADLLQVSVINLLGQKVAFYENSLDAGSHSFVFYPGDDRYYILTATANGLTKTIKMVNLNNHSAKQVLLNYQGLDETVPGNKSIQETSDFGYSLGDQLRFTGFAKNPSDIAGSDVIEATPAGNENYVFDIIEGIPCPGTPTVTYEGQAYNTVQIGHQCWFKENLNVGTMINGSFNQTNNSEKEKYCFDNNEANCTTYGGLYQWDETMQYTTQQSTQGICPSGWHIPSDAEWTILTDFLGVEPVAGGKMKETGTTHWNSPNTGATNESGFTAFPGGYRDYNGFFGMGNYSYFWSSTEFYTANAWCRKLSYNYTNVYRYSNFKTYGFSVRCVQGLTVTTSEITDVTETTATSGGEVTEDGGAEVIERGVCWSTSQNPTIADSHTSDGSGIGIFVSNLIGLTFNTPYYLRAYATNINGTVYGNQLYFTTSGVPCPGTPTVTYQGQTYNTVQIGNLCWLKENLNVGSMIQGNEEMTDNGIIEKYCYNNDPAKCATYGGLYQWNEMMQYTTQQSTQGICPTGWRIPSDAEWTILTDFLGGESVAGGKMKETGTTHWISPNTGATNESGFTALPGGCRHSGYGFLYLGSYAYFWSSTEYDTYGAWIRYLFNFYSGAGRDYDSESYGFSVRCVQGLTVTTSEITDVTETTAKSGGEVIDEGGSEVTERGVCWSTSQNPTISDSHTSDGSGIGIFVSNLIGLTLNTPYYVRAYATNINGTAYGNQLYFTTSSVPCPGTPTVTYEGQTYNTMQIGDQCWFKENLNVGTMINGSGNQTNNSQKEKYCFDNNEANCTTYGGLYQWDEMMQYATQQSTQGICPTGWHIPSDAEWTILTDFLGGESVAGGKMKETGTTHWISPNTGATNESGFTALPGGYRELNGYFNALGIYTYFWSSTEYGPNYSWHRLLEYDNANVHRDYYYKFNGVSVRCLQD